MTQPRTPIAKLLLLFTALLTLTGTLSAATINVPGDSATIQGAIDAASDGDTVQVAAGTYTENINFNGKNISVIGAGPDEYIFEYYNVSRTHMSLEKDSPEHRAVEKEGRIISKPILCGLHHVYSRVA